MWSITKNQGPYPHWLRPATKMRCWLTVMTYCFWCRQFLDRAFFCLPRKDSLRSHSFMPVFTGRPILYGMPVAGSQQMSAAAAARDSIQLILPTTFRISCTSFFFYWQIRIFYLQSIFDVKIKHDFSLRRHTVHFSRAGYINQLSVCIELSIWRMLPAQTASNNTELTAPEASKHTENERKQKYISTL